MKSNILRKLYLDFFRSKEHKIISSAPMVVKNDPTLMFTNAGMNQFKDIFLGNSTPTKLRIANSQKCLRVSGKHNDLEEVGHDTYHHTMFEMLGSWSFGDYFKENAINWAWEFLTNVCKLDTNRIYVTVFEGSKNDDLAKDTESYNFWKLHLPKERILNGHKKDNFWEMGETGPCGPCSEIHYDNRNDKERSTVNGATLVNNNHPQVIEIWNLVFIEYNRFNDGKLALLPNKHVDTGMGFERLSMIMQGVRSNYDTDIFQPLINVIANKANTTYGENEKQDIAIRVIADHIRAISFSIADGQLPSNVKAGYVIRRILRRAVRYGYTFLDLKAPFMYDLIEVLVNQLGEYFPELKSQQGLISKVIKEEEESFLRTLKDGLKRINEMIRISNGQISGKEVFELYDTYGFPVDLTALILKENNLVFNQQEFNNAMNEQKLRSKKAGSIKKDDWKIIEDNKKELFIGYSKLESEINITRYRRVVTKEKEQYELVFNITPFYPEGGGQVGDIGTITSKNQTIEIINCKKENKLIIHLVDVLPKNINTTFTAKVDIHNRMTCSKNHTATHLLHESLRFVLGEHVSQKGSLVNSDYLRFDFTHFSKISREELQNIEDDINRKILANIPLIEHKDLSLKEAKKMGALMFFGEKYDDIVRMIQFDTSKELCGGTHVNATGEIGLLKIVSEGSISSGIRRIEAITGMKAINYLNTKANLVDDLGKIVKHKDVKNAINQLIIKNKELEKEIAEFKKNNIINIKEELLEKAIQIESVRLISQEVLLEADDIKSILFGLRKEKQLAVLLGARTQGKALLTIMLSDDLVKKGLNATELIKELAKDIKGSGGGQPFFATAGGSQVKGITKALSRFKTLIK